MADVKTRPTRASVRAFLDKVENPERRADCRTLVRIMKQATGAQPRMWGPSLVGFGSYHYVYASGREGDWPLAGFSPRKGDLTLYIMAGLERFPTLMRRLGRFRSGRSCLYVRRLADVDLKVLRELIAASARHMRRAYPARRAGDSGRRR